MNVLKLATGFDWPVILMKAAGYLVCGLLGLAALIAPGWLVRGAFDTQKATAIQAAWDKETADRKAQEIEQAKVALGKSERTLQETQNANDATAAETRRASVAIGSLRTERDRVQDVAREFEHRLAELSDSEATGGGDAGGASTRELLRECSREAEALAGEHGEMAASATALAGQVRSLQRYARIVSGEPVIRPEGDRGDR